MLNYPLMGSKPVSRDRISELLDEVLVELEANPNLLSRIDRETLAVLRWEFTREAERSDRESPPASHPEGESRLQGINDWMTSKNWFTKTFYDNGINLYSYTTEDFDAYIDPRGSARIIRQEGEDEPIVITAVGIRFRGTIGNDLGIYLDFLDTTERGRGPYWDRTQLYEDRTGYVGNVKGDESINYDVTDFDLAIGNNLIELHAAKIPLRWGPGHSGQLLLSDWGTSFHQFQAIFKMGSHLRLVYLFGSLKSYPEIADTLYMSAGYYRTIESTKYIAAHRLEWNPHRRLRLAFAEAVVFGERDPELAYLIPINFFYSAEHDLGDEDNALLSLDASWIPYPHWKLYGEFLIDDITFDKLGSDYFGNKLGWLGGLFLVEPAGFRNFDATFEMAQIRPFVYSNRYPINVYTHWTSSLGYRYPPNSQLIYAALRYRPHRRVQIQVEWTNHRHGASTEDENVGDVITIPQQYGAPENAPFLGGTLEKVNWVNVLCDYEVFLGLHIWGRGTWLDPDGNNFWEWEMGFRLN